MDKLSYSLGLSVAGNLINSGVKDLNFDDFKSGVMAVLNGEEPELKLNEVKEILDDFFKKSEEEKNKQMEEFFEHVKKESEDFLYGNATNPDVVVTASGLQYKVITEGTGKTPGEGSRVKCHYEGRFVTGQKFDSSYDRNEPAVFGLNQVIAGWAEGLKLMKEGSTYEFYIPYTLGYGENGIQDVIPPYATLIFRIKLIEVL